MPVTANEKVGTFAAPANTAGSTLVARASAVLVGGVPSVVAPFGLRSSLAAAGSAWTSLL
ncbi:MAG TPA: hypothetical protein VNB94_06075 [Mycobacteriales bacterium]|nr:hypothetical protein [Mycobacteriales bacterium]